MSYLISYHDPMDPCVIYLKWWKYDFVQVCFAPSSLRKDQYNKKIRKYQVVYQEEESEVSEDEEKAQQSEQISGNQACFYTNQVPQHL